MPNGFLKNAMLILELICFLLFYIVGFSNNNISYGSVNTREVFNEMLLIY